MKVHMKRAIGSQFLNFKQFNSILAEIEAVVNSRQLTALSEDPKNLLP